MPKTIKRTTKDGKPAYQWENGKKYTYTAGDKASRERAKAKALKQQKAAYINTYGSGG